MFCDSTKVNYIILHFIILYFIILSFIARAHDDNSLTVGGCSLTGVWGFTSDTVKQAVVELSESPQSCMCKVGINLHMC